MMRDGRCKTRSKLVLSDTPPPSEHLGLFDGIIVFPNITESYSFTTNFFEAVSMRLPKAGIIFRKKGSGQFFVKNP